MMQRGMCVCASIALVLAGPAAAQDRNGRDRDRGPVETETVERTLSLQPGGEIRLRTFAGRVNIRATGGDNVTVKAVRRATRERLDTVQLDITQSGNAVTIDANRRTGDRRDDNVVETDFDIEVPARVDLNVRTFSAPVTVTGLSGEMDIEGFSAEIRLAEVAGPMRLKTFSGGIELEARDWMEGDDLDVTTFSGDVTLRLPDSARGEVTFDGFSGRLDSDLPVTLSSSGRRNVRGTLNGGGNTDFRFNTFSGSVRIRR
jgi:hypothetical protein